jgi:hypothetical protein
VTDENDQQESREEETKSSLAEAQEATNRAKNAQAKSEAILPFVYATMEGLTGKALELADLLDQASTDLRERAEEAQKATDLLKESGVHE